MKRIKYLRGESPDNLLVFTRPYTETDVEIAKVESYNGEYTIEDDGTEDPTAEPTLEDRVGTLETDTADLAEALDMILSGVVE